MVMSHFKISTSERWHPTACLSWKEGSVKAASVLARTRSVWQPEQLVGELHSQAATAFSSGLCYQLITDADAGGDEEARARPGDERRGRKQGHCFQKAVLV